MLRGIYHQQNLRGPESYVIPHIVKLTETSSGCVTSSALIWLGLLVTSPHGDRHLEKSGDRIFWVV